MKINVDNYADFVTAVKTVAGIDAVFYYDNSPNTFRLYALMSGGELAAHVTPLASKPGSFDADFPDAVALTADYAIG